MAKTKKATVPTKKQIHLILESLKPKECGLRDAAIILLTCTTGLRITEVSRLTIKDILFKVNGIRCECTLRGSLTKNKKSRQFYLSNQLLRQHLQAYLDYRIQKRQQLGKNPEQYMGLNPDSCVFLTRTGYKIGLNTKRRVNSEGERVDYYACDYLANQMKKHYVENGVRGGSSHSGRRFFANTVYRMIEGQHRRLYITQLLMGHEDAEQTLDYKYAADKVGGII